MDFDPGFIPRLSYHFGRSSFRWTVANPQLGDRSNVIGPSEFVELSGRCLDMLQQAAGLNIQAELDCPLPLCFFSPADLAWVRQYHPDTAGRMGHCNPVLDVTPELEAIRCFALSRLDRVKVTDFANEWSILEWFRRNIDTRLLHQGCFADCVCCGHFTAGRCSGGCLAWHEYKSSSEPPMLEYQLVQTMRKAVNQGQPVSALDEYTKAEQRLQKDIPAFIAAVAAYQTGELDRAFRYAARAMDTTWDPNIKKQSAELLKSINPDTGRLTREPDISIPEVPLVTIPPSSTEKDSKKG
jgi:cyclic pyranopterin phosphate synthase